MSVCVCGGGKDADYAHISYLASSVLNYPKKNMFCTSTNERAMIFPSLFSII